MVSACAKTRAQHSLTVRVATSVNNKLREVTTGKTILWNETDGRGGPSFVDTWVLRMAKTCLRWQVDMLMGLALSAVLIQFFSDPG